MITALLLLVITGCGGSNPITPNWEEDEYRLVLIRANGYGGTPITKDTPDVDRKVKVRQGIPKGFLVRNNMRTVKNGVPGQWVAIDDALTVNVTIAGIESGKPIPDIGLSGGQHRAYTGTLSVEFNPPLVGTTGTAKIDMLAEETGARLSFWVTVLPPIENDPPIPPPPDDPPPPVENHPPIITGYSPSHNIVTLHVGDPIQIFNVSGNDPDGDEFESQWKLGYGPWVKSNDYSFMFNPVTEMEWMLSVQLFDGKDYSELVIWTIEIYPEDNPPPVEYSLRVFGALGEFHDNGILEIDEGDGYSLPDWELWSDSGTGSKVFLNITDVEFDSELPDWVWDSSKGELITVLWANPDYPDPEDPGNIFINPGNYLISFEVSHDSKMYARSGTLRVLDQPNFP